MKLVKEERELGSSIDGELSGNLSEEVMFEQQPDIMWGSCMNTGA